MKKIIVSFVALFVVAGMVSLTIPAPTLAIAQGQDSDNLAHVLISFDKPVGPSEQALVRAHGGEIKYSYSIVDAIAATLPARAIEGLSRNPHVTAVEMDGPVYAADIELDNSWGVKRIGAGTVHDVGNKGTGVKIGIIDSGVNYLLPDLKDNFDPANLGYDFVQSDTDPLDVYGHGTHVAGTACAEDNGFGVVGVAPNCALYSLRVLNDDGVGSWSKTIAAMQWALDNGLQVVNLSLGNSKNPGTAVKTAFDNAEKAGIVIVAAAGNSGNTAGKGDNIIYPAKYASVIAVGATDSTNKRASFSSTGSTLELMAPGVLVLSTWNDDTSYLNPQPICLDDGLGLGGVVCYYKYGSGTSMASPHVAGVAALVISKVISSGTFATFDANHNGRINDEVRAKLDSTATDLGTAGKDAQHGYGLVNAVAATQ